MADTVDNAKRTPDQVQPWAVLGLKDAEYARISEILGRRPTSSELAMDSVMWSEHCSYESSKVHLRQFAELAPETVHPTLGRTLADLWRDFTRDGHPMHAVDIGWPDDRSST